MNRLVALAAALLLAACATRPPHPEAFAFAVIGDVPYDAREEKAFVEIIETMSGQDLAFVVHVGDIKAGGNSPCTDALYAERRSQFDASAHPWFYVPGDNDWVDCRRKSNGASDPIERLARLRQVFFPDASRMLGRRALAVESYAMTCGPQGAPCRSPRPENARWHRNGVVFTTLNIQGSNDNSGFDAASDREQAERREANLQWLAEAVAAAAASQARALVVFVQANPFVPSRNRIYDPYNAALVKAAERLGRPVLFVHGDTHTYQVDAPFVDSSGRPVENPVRLETFGSPFVGWVKVNVDPGRPGLFTFHPRVESPSPVSP